ncbi:MAG TPA: hypothetical protein VED40_01025 [Azospirillaceae bacterium]|nr:hypothetical protein [Azospirillaceae bacterium]
MKTIARMAACAPLLLLTACGGEPSETEMRAAIEKQIADANAFVGGMGKALLGKDVTTRVMSLDKHECKARADSNGYVCSFTMTTRNEMVGTRTSTLETVFLKGSDGWTAQ